jgi:hypothetical protein
MTVDARTNEHKVALRPLGVLPLHDKVVIADTMFSHRDNLDGCNEVALYFRRTRRPCGRP